MAYARDRTVSGVLPILTPQLLLVVAGVLVAVSILVGQPLGRAINGIAGAAWVASAVWMVVSLRHEPRRTAIGLSALVLAAVLAIVVRPGTYLEAVIGFGIAGAVVAVVTRPSGFHWALLVPSLYFPLHISIALGRVVASGGARAVRTDPPPTDAFVPLAMIVAAGFGGYLVSRAISRREEGRPH